MSQSYDPFPVILSAIEAKGFTLHDEGLPSQDGQVRWVCVRRSGVTHLVFCCIGAARPGIMYWQTAALKCSPNQTHHVTSTAGETGPEINWSTFPINQ